MAYPPVEEQTGIREFPFTEDYLYQGLHTHIIF